jgi:uncharacterized integral membrane protein (TIGR00698 family)
MFGAVLSLWPGLAPWLALLGGTAIALTAGNPCERLTARLSKGLLQIAVIGLGAGVNLTVVLRTGAQGLGYTLIGLLGTFALGLWLARRMGVSQRIAALICAGTGICGGSAIAAAAPAIDANPEETSAALATVFLLNGLALVVFPLVGHWSGLDARQFGLWCALAIHDTSSVTGAAATHGAEALAVATTVKLARALWIMPVALVLGTWLRPREHAGKRLRRLPVPWFIAGFLVVSALFTLVPAFQPFAPGVLTGARAALNLTLFLIGAGLTRAAQAKLGLRPFLYGLMLWAVVAGASLLAIDSGWVR